MIRLILTAALIGGALRYVFGEGLKRAPHRRTARARGRNRARPAARAAR